MVREGLGPSPTIRRGLGQSLTTREDLGLSQTSNTNTNNQRRTETRRDTGGTEQVPPSNYKQQIIDNNKGEQPQPSTSSNDKETSDLNVRSNPKTPHNAKLLASTNSRTQPQEQPVSSQKKYQYENKDRKSTELSLKQNDKPVIVTTPQVNKVPLNETKSSKPSIPSNEKQTLKRDVQDNEEEKIEEGAIRKNKHCPRTEPQSNLCLAEEKKLVDYESMDEETTQIIEKKKRDRRDSSPSIMKARRINTRISDRDLSRKMVRNTKLIITPEITINETPVETALLINHII